MISDLPPRLGPSIPAWPRIGSLCTGYGGLDLAIQRVLGGHLVWCADPDPHIGVILAARFPGVPNLGDVTCRDWATVPPVDVITAGFPCQDISCAGKRAGITEGTRSGIWINIAHTIRQLRPSLAFVENVAALRTFGLGSILADLAASGYDARWTCVRASDVGAPHHRDRLFLAAWPASAGAAAHSASV
ncbi:MAG: DNA cytosine methyltransferase [Dactylosporangium sp.]|nr:DNA cytosine methyltransferase [Dactylosporangium sp.]NNJ63223.1 DNA cytosine methyltransferase [Dactylosporangium sp.]